MISASPFVAYFVFFVYINGGMNISCVLLCILELPLKRHISFKAQRVAFRAHHIWQPFHRRMYDHWRPIQWQGLTVSVILCCRSSRVCR